MYEFRHAFLDDLAVFRSPDSRAGETESQSERVKKEQDQKSTRSDIQILRSLILDVSW